MELVESFLKVVREHLRVSEELSNVTVFAAGSPSKRRLSGRRSDVRGGVIEAERVKQGRREEGQWCRGMGVWEPVLRKGMDGEGAKTVSLLRVDTDKGHADRPNYRSRLIVREIKRAMKRSYVPSAADVLSGMPPLECVKTPLSVRLPQSRRGERQANSRNV